MLWVRIVSGPLDILPMLEAEARERQRKAGKEHGRGMEKLTTELKEAIPRTEAAAQAAELVGASATRIMCSERTFKGERRGR